MILLNRDIRLLRLPALVIDKSAFVLTFLVALACLLQSSFEAAASWPPAVRCLSLNRPYLLAGPLQGSPTMRHQPGCYYCCLAITATGFPRYTQ